MGTKQREGAPKRLNIDVSNAVHNELTAFAQERESTLTAVVRLALSVIRVMCQEERKGNRIVITTSEGKPIKEIVLTI